MVHKIHQFDGSFVHFLKSSQGSHKINYSLGTHKNARIFQRFQKSLSAVARTA